MRGTIRVRWRGASAAGARPRSCGRRDDAVPGERTRVRRPALAEVQRGAAVGALHLVDEPRAPVDLGAPDLGADGRDIALVEAALELASIGVLPDPDHAGSDAGVERGRAAHPPDRL